MARMASTILLLQIVYASVCWAQVEADVSFAGGTVQLEFRGEKQWSYQLQKKNSGKSNFYEIDVPALSLSAIANLREFTSPLIKKITVDPKGTDGKTNIKFEMADSGIEAFDYLTDQPSRLIVDFYRPENASVSKKSIPAEPAKAKTEKTSEKTISPKLAQELPDKTEFERKPANDTLVVNPQGEFPLDLSKAPEGFARTGIFDGADPKFDRFSMKDYEIREEAVIASRENVYLNFPVLKVDSARLQGLLVKRPVYSITPKEGEANKQARLLLTLFQNRRYNVFLKAVNWFLEKFPNSEYDEMVRFMWADNLYAMYLQDKKKVEYFDLAMLRYRQVLEKYPDSDLAERTQLLMSFATLDRGDYLQTLRMFLDHIRKRPQSANRDVSQLAIADTYARLSRFKEAEEVYSEVEKNSLDPRYKAEAAFLKGDVFFEHARTLSSDPKGREKKFADAIKEYRRALDQYPAFKSEFPNALYNQAAAYFWNKNYRQSLETYRDFFVEFPSHDFSGYAMTRVGELLAILGASPTKVTGAYLETYFRYGNTPSAVVARLRMLSERMRSMKPKEVEKAVADIKKLSLESRLPEIEQFATILISDGYTSRKEFQKAVDLLVTFYQGNPTAPDLEPVRNRIVKNINQELRELIEKGGFISGLKLHNKYAGSWLKNSPRIDTRFFVALAYEQAGAYKDAEGIYKDVLNKIYSIQGTVAEKERSVLESLPATDRLNLRLSSISFQQNKFRESYDFLKAVKSPEKLSEIDQIERVQLAAFLLDERGETEAATRYLVDLMREWKGIPQLVAEPFLTLARYEIKLGRIDDALRSLRRIDQIQIDSKSVNPDTHSKALELLALQLHSTGQKRDSIRSFESLLAQYESKKPLASMRYQLGKIHYELGEVKKAEEIWRSLKEEKHDFWYRLAQEQLSNARWKDGYNKYIERIPAMSERK